MTLKSLRPSSSARSLSGSCDWNSRGSKGFDILGEPDAMTRLAEAIAEKIGGDFVPLDRAEVFARFDPGAVLRRGSHKSVSATSGVSSFCWRPPTRARPPFRSRSRATRRTRIRWLARGMPGMSSRSTNPPVCDEDRAPCTRCSMRETLHDVCFSPDGAAVAFIASSGGRYVIQDAKGGRNAFVHAKDLVVGPFGETTACHASTGAGQTVVRNSMPGPLFEWIGRPILNADGRAVAVLGSVRGRDRLSWPSGGRVFCDD